MRHITTPLLGGKRVADSRDQRIGPYHHMVADIHLPDVEDGEVEIAKEIIPDKDVLPTVAREALRNPRSLAHAAQHLLEIFILRLAVHAVDGIIFLASHDGQ